MSSSLSSAHDSSASTKLAWIFADNGDIKHKQSLERAACWLCFWVIVPDPVLQVSQKVANCSLLVFIDPEPQAPTHMPRFTTLAGGPMIQSFLCSRCGLSTDSPGLQVSTATLCYIALLASWSPTISHVQCPPGVIGLQMHFLGYVLHVPEAGSTTYYLIFRYRQNRFHDDVFIHVYYCQQHVHFCASGQLSIVTRGHIMGKRRRNHV